MKFIEMSESYRHVEIRKLPFGSLTRIIDILEIDHDWKKLMSQIPKHPQNSYFEPKYNNEHIRLIENDSQLSGRKCTAILFEEWGTSGRIRPTLSTLKDILLKCEMYRAADEVASLLREAPPQRPTNGPAAPIDTDVSLLLNEESTKQKMNEMDSLKGRVTANSYDHFNNKTTIQLKSASDFIKFSSTSPTAPDMSMFTPDKKSAVDSNLIKFSQSDYLGSSELPNVSALTPTNQLNTSLKSHNNHELSQNINTIDIPNLTALMNNTGVSTRKFSNSESGIQSSASELSESSDLSATPVSNTQIPSSYQMTFPNIDLSTTINLSRAISNEIFENSNLINFKYEELQELTNNFSEQVSVGPNSITGKIGMGGFGEVFVALHPDLGAIAIKKAHDELLNYRKSEITIRLFNAEVKYLSQFQHENIVPILGYSRDGPAPCIVCEYIDGGSLEHKIAAKVLNEKQRIDIMVGTAEGLKYLHKSESYDGTSESQSVKRTNFVHGDVKSANILLTRDCVPKLCDFGLAKQYNDTFVTTSPMGTSAYMAPEGLSGTITQKVDIYSFGIVLLELLTGLKSIVIDDNEQINIKDYVEEFCENKDISGLLDDVIEKWLKANEIFDLAKECLERNRKKRLAIEDVCERLNKIRI